MALKSRIPAIAAEIPLKMDAVAAAAATMISQRAKDRVPVASGKLRDAIHVERRGVSDYAVVAGDREAFYGHIVEHGGAHTPARPFMTPALEDSRDEILAMATGALKAL
jgi:HK97 gp10 family phage protein